MPSRFEDFPALPDSAVRLFTDEDREPEPPTPVMILDRGLPSNIARWAPNLSSHDAPLVSRDGRGIAE